MCGTPWFKAPELILEMPYEKTLDVWALGCVFEYLLNPGNFIFKHKDASKKKYTTKFEQLRDNQKLALQPIFEKLGKPKDDHNPSMVNEPVVQ